MSGRTVKLVVISGMLAGTLVAETHKEFRMNVGPKAGVTVINSYGSISVKPSTGSMVIINASLSSDKAQVDNNSVGNRVEIQTHLLPGADEQSGRVDYEVLVPADASVNLHSSTGPLRAEKLHGDVRLEGSAATVEIHDMSGAYVHIKTLNGPVTLTNVDGSVEVDSLTGEVTLNSVTGPLVQVISTSGNINYIGDFGDGGQYRLTSHSGDIFATVPDSTSADVNARSVRGEVKDDIPLQPKSSNWLPTTPGSTLLGTMGRAAVSSTVMLRSFSGKIHLRKRTSK